jgi:hypothetical protein
MSQVMVERACAKGLTVWHGVSEVTHLTAVCDTCDARSAVDGLSWLKERSGKVLLSSLRTRMRCKACGGRSAHFDIMWGAQPTGVPRSTVWRFL